MSIISVLNFGIQQNDDESTSVILFAGNTRFKTNGYNFCKTHIQQFKSDVENNITSQFNNGDTCLFNYKNNMLTVSLHDKDNGNEMYFYYKLLDDDRSRLYAFLNKLLSIVQDHECESN